MFSRLKLAVMGALMLAALFFAAVWRAFRDGVARERARQAEQALDAARRADHAARAYDREGLVDRLRRGGF